VSFIGIFFRTSRSTQHFGSVVACRSAHRNRHPAVYAVFFIVTEGWDRPVGAYIQDWAALDIHAERRFTDQSPQRSLLERAIKVSPLARQVY